MHWPSSEIFLASLPELIREAAKRWRGLYFEVFCGGLAPVCDLFVLNRLSLVEGRQTGLLHRRDMHEHILAARRRLDKSITLRRVEPLDRTFSHHDFSAGLPPRSRTASPRQPAGSVLTGYAECGGLGSSNHIRLSPNSAQLRGVFAGFARFPVKRPARRAPSVNTSRCCRCQNC